MKLLYGTTNQAKLNSMREHLKGLDLEIISLNDIHIQVSDVDESGNNPLENAKIKALAYYQATKTPVFSCDSGLYIEGLSDAEQPGVHIRRVNEKILTDKEMAEYYASMATYFGGEMKAVYKNGICLVIDEQTIFTYDGEDICSESFIISSKPHSEIKIGFPLDSISYSYQDSKGHSFYEQGFRDFFQRTVLTGK